MERNCGSRESKNDAIELSIWFHPIQPSSRKLYIYYWYLNLLPYLSNLEGYSGNWMYCVVAEMALLHLVICICHL